jgi:hypothetical protein
VRATEPDPGTINFAGSDAFDGSAIVPSSGDFSATNSQNNSHGFRESLIVSSRQFEWSLAFPVSDFFLANNAGSNAFDDSAILASSRDFTATNSRNGSHGFRESGIISSKQFEWSLAFQVSGLFDVNHAESGNQGGFSSGLISGVAIGYVAACLLAVAIFFLLRQRQTDASDISYETGYETDGKVESGDHLDLNQEADMSFTDTPVMFEDDSWIHGHVFSHPNSFVYFSAEEAFI